MILAKNMNISAILADFLWKSTRKKFELIILGLEKLIIFARIY
jgi:hypothetical protein